MKKIIILLVVLCTSNVLIAQVFITTASITLTPKAQTPALITTIGSKLRCTDLVLAATITDWQLDSDLEITCEKITHLGGVVPNVITLSGNHTLTIITKDGTTGNVKFQSENNTTYIKYSKK